MTRSILFVPADSPRKFDKARGCGADALILDLEDGVAEAAKPAARTTVRDMLGAPRDAQALWVRVNALDSGLIDADLDAVVPLAPFGIVLPKCRGGEDVRALDALLARREAAAGLPRDGLRVLPVATETAGSVFGLGSYAGCSPRLWGLTWGAEDLAADVGALTNQHDGRYTEPFRIVRALCLFAAAAAGVRALDAVCVDLRDPQAAGREAREARRDGFTGKVAIHPSHVGPINDAFTPSEAERAFAQRVIDAFAANPDSGALRLDGRMVDRPHLRAARRVLGLE